ncbi:MAG: hypothetical protein ABT01_05345 [Clostridium sp. SCN 57-10]|nr:MAG: hypothetical protein ABT01_05345 [Clostridium sp. SCN 57-10]
MTNRDELRAFLLDFSIRLTKVEEEFLSAGLAMTITSPEIRILEHIGPQGAAKMSGVARALGVTLATLTVACDRLEAKELIERRRDENDRRSVCAVLTPLGLVAYHYHVSFHQHIAEVLLDGFSEEEARLFSRFMHNLNGFLENNQ